MARRAKSAETKPREAPTEERTYPRQMTQYNPETDQSLTNTYTVGDNSNYNTQPVRFGEDQPARGFNLTSFYGFKQTPYRSLAGSSLYSLDPTHNSVVKIN